MVRWCGSLAVLTATSLALGGCGAPSDDTGEDADALTVVADVTTQLGWQRVLDGFAVTEDGADVDVATTFGNSSDLAGEVLDDQPADLVTFADGGDLDQLVSRGMVAESWADDATGGVPFTSVVSFVVRAGNPKGISDWDDLLRPGVKVVTDDPVTCAAARVNLVAPYAVTSAGGEDPDAGLDFVRQLVTEHLIAPGRAAGCGAADAFDTGPGDVLLTTEATAIQLERRGDAVERVYPPETFEVSYPTAVVSGSAHTRPAALLRTYLFTTEAQRLWAQSGYRPVDPAAIAEYSSEFPSPDKLWTVADLDGWGEVGRRLSDEGTGALAEIYQDVAR